MVQGPYRVNQDRQQILRSIFVCSWFKVGTDTLTQRPTCRVIFICIMYVRHSSLFLSLPLFPFMISPSELSPNVARNQWKRKLYLCLYVCSINKIKNTNPGKVLKQNNEAVWGSQTVTKYIRDGISFAEQFSYRDGFIRHSRCNEAKHK